MGTKGSYTGSKTAKPLVNTITDWLDGTDIAPNPTDQQNPDTTTDTTVSPLAPEALRPAMRLIRPRGTGGGDGPGGMGGAGTRAGAGRTGGGRRRSAPLSAGTAGRAAGAAHAFRIGDAATLESLGLDYGRLFALSEPVDVVSHIVDAVCGPLSDGTIEGDERRFVVAQVAGWVLEEGTDGDPPDADSIVREAISRILFEVVTTETAASIRDGDRPASATVQVEQRIRNAADVLAQQASLSPSGATAAELERAIEDGIETLRTIFPRGT